MGMSRGFSPQPIVIAATRYAKKPTHDFNWKMESPLLHERVPGSNSLAKYAVAFFRISHSIRVSTSSLRNRRLSASRSDAERIPGADVWLEYLALAIQLPNVPLGKRRNPLVNAPYYGGPPHGPELFQILFDWHLGKFVKQSRGGRPLDAGMYLRKSHRQVSRQSGEGPSIAKEQQYLVDLVSWATLFANSERSK